MVKKLPESLKSKRNNWELYDDVDYEAFWEDKKQRRQDNLEKYLISRLVPKSGMRIIDVGGGYGRLSHCYKNRFSLTVLFDGSISLLRKARQKIQENIYFIAGDINHIPFRNASFDCVLMIRVLQHIFDVESILKEINRIIANEGHLIFSYHNKRNVHRIFNWLLGREKDSPFSDHTKEVSPALLSHHPEYINKSLWQNRFEPPYYLGAVFIDQVAEITEKISEKIPSGARWAHIMGRLWASPWLIGKTKPRNGKQIIKGESLEQILVCPICKDSVQKSENKFICSLCGRNYPIYDGIIDFRPY